MNMNDPKKELGSRIFSSENIKKINKKLYHYMTITPLKMLSVFAVIIFPRQHGMCYMFLHRNILLIEIGQVQQFYKLEK